MALEPAGVSLEAEGFRDYLNKLDAIDKRQREIFDTRFKGTEKTFKEITRAANKYAATQKKAADEAKKLQLAEKTAAATRQQAIISTGNAIIDVVGQVVSAGTELAKLGAQFEGQQKGLENLAGSFGQSSEAIQKAIQDASKGTLSGLDAISAANQGLLLGVAKTPEEFAALTNSAVTLGRVLGLDAKRSIEEFTLALGRGSTEILDNFGISAKQVNQEIERLAQANFGKARSELTEAQKQATFMEAALNVAGKAAATIGDEAGEAIAAFDRLSSAGEDFKVELGLAIGDLNKGLGVTEGLTNLIKDVTDDIKVFRVAFGGGDTEDQISSLTITIQRLEEEIAIAEERVARGGVLGFLSKFKIGPGKEELAELRQELAGLELEKEAEDAKKFKQELEDIPPVVEDNTEAIKAFESALKSAQSLQLNFAREAEDIARKRARADEDLAEKQARANEDIARSQAKAILNLEEDQAKAREKLLKDQAKRREDFEKQAQKQVAKAEDDIAKARKEAGEERKRDQKKLQRDLAREQERFNLSQLQSERRFKLSERRLIAEGDILAIQQLREDRDLQRQEEKENFDLSQKDRVSSAAEQQKEQAKDLEDRVKTLKSNLEEQRAELLTGFDEQIEAQRQAQAEAQIEQQKGFEEAAAERAIAQQREEEDRAKALERENEDRRISQRRQLEDLGIALAEQKDVTATGVNAIAEEIERVFGLDGAANNIIVGFSERTRSEFKDLFENVENIVKEVEPEPIRVTPLVSLTGDAGGRTPTTTSGLGREIAAFQDGGIVPGPIGSPQIIQAHGGETVLPTHQQSFSMAAPVIPAQNLNVNMAGGFNITGDNQANDQILQAATEEMTKNFRIAIERIARRN